jgi:uncharacterized membrane protein
MKLLVKASPNRIQIIDGLRGISILLMVLYHFGYDLVAFCGAPEGLIYNPVLEVLQPFFAGVFILLSGISCRFSKNNYKRGLQTLLAGMIVTLVTYLMDRFAGGSSGNTIWFGILHFLGAAAILHAALGRALDKIAPAVQAALYLVLYFCSFIFTRRTYDVGLLWWLGIKNSSFASADYFPLLPWIFVYFLGALAGKYVVRHSLPDWFYSFRVPFFSAVGRNTMLVYLAHQPVLYLLIQLILLTKAHIPSV